MADPVSGEFQMRYPDKIVTLCLLLAVVSSEKPGLAAGKENLARKATVSATSTHDNRFLPKFAVDGVVPDCACRDDEIGRAWCVLKRKTGDSADFVLQWKQPIDVSEIVYFGRTAWMMTECFRDFEVYLDDARQPAVSGSFQMIHGPQRIRLPEGTKVSRIKLRFLSSYGGMNPGAAEIMVFAASPSDEELAKIVGGGEGDVVVQDTSWAKHLGCRELVVIRRREINPTHVYTYHAEGFRPGGGLFVLSADDDEAALRELVASPTGQILDCDLSYDGREILFSWKTGKNQPYQLYRIPVDGGQPVQLTEGDAHNFNACWLPDGGIAFLSTRKPAFAYCWTSPVGILHRMDRDGGNVRRLSANYLNDFTPSVMADGRILYSRWEYVDRPAIPIQSLWALKPDGTGLSVVYGNRVLTPGTFMEAHSIPGTTKLLCTMTGHGGPCRGAIGIIDRSHGVNAQAAIRNLTPEINIGRVDVGFSTANRVRGPYESPYPIDGERFLVSRRGTLLLRDYDGSRQWEILRPAGGLGFYGARPLRARPRPPVLPSALPEQPDAWATVYVQDVYNGLEPLVKRGEVKQICVVQEIEKSRLAQVQRRAFGFQFPVVSCGATYAPKKVWGYVPVAEDGSALFKVPAGVPIYFMAIDAEGRAVQRMRSFTHFMPGEAQSCIGCHENRLSSSEAGALPLAYRRAPLELTSPEWGRAGFSYARVVQPVFDRHCTSCHHPRDPAGGIDLTGDRTDYFNVSYEVLARQGTMAMNPERGGVSREGKEMGRNPYTSWIPTYNGAEHNILQIAPKTWGSPASKLADLLLGGHPDADGKRRLKLSENERRRVLTWIDLNVPYYGTSESNHYDLKGCRRIVPAQLDNVLANVAKSRCAACHAQGIPRKFYTRITNPHLNDFLLSPLAKSAGGSGRCGQAVFQTTDDPDYQRILGTFAPVAELLSRNTRMDMLASKGAE